MKNEALESAKGRGKEGKANTSISYHREMKIILFTPLIITDHTIFCASGLDSFVVLRRPMQLLWPCHSDEEHHSEEGVLLYSIVSQWIQPDDLSNKFSSFVSYIIFCAQWPCNYYHACKIANLKPTTPCFMPPTVCCPQNHLLNPRSCSFLHSQDAASATDTEVALVLECLRAQQPNNQIRMNTLIPAMTIMDRNAFKKSVNNSKEDLSEAEQHSSCDIGRHGKSAATTLGIIRMILKCV